MENPYENVAVFSWSHGKYCGLLTGAPQPNGGTGFHKLWLIIEPINKLAFIGRP